VPTKKVKVFACRATFSPIREHLNLAESSKFNKLDENWKELKLLSGNTPHLLVVDKEKRGFVFGRFIRLRKEAPPILDTQSKTEEDFELTITRYLEEISHFIWHLNDGLMLCQYNHYGIRHFPTSLNPYFNMRWKDDFTFRDDVILPIDNPETFEEFKRDKSAVLAFKVRIAKKDVVLEERERNKGWRGVLNSIFGWGTFYNLVDGDESCYEIVVRKGRWKTGEVKKGKVVEAVEQLKSGDREVHISAETQDACYDLIEGNLFNYKMTVETKEEEYETEKRLIVNKEAFFREAERQYNLHAQHILSTLAETND
jgi:hypothetical protein